MRATMLALLVGATAAMAAAPPLRPWKLSEEQERQAALLLKQADQSGQSGDFERAENLMRQRLELHERILGKWHWETVDDRLDVESWRNLTKLSPANRKRYVATFDSTRRCMALVQQ